MNINRKFFVIPSVTFQMPKTKHIKGGFEKLTMLASIEANVTYATCNRKTTPVLCTGGS